MSEKKINLVRDFGKNPGGRFRRLGPSSGEEFRQDFLEPALANFDRVEVCLNGAVGLPSSFIDEAFGVLVDQVGIETVRRKLVIVLDDDPITKTKLEMVLKAHA